MCIRDVSGKQDEECRTGWYVVSEK